MNKQSWIATALLAGISAMSSARAFAQAPAPHPETVAESDQASYAEDIRLLRKDLRSLKKQIIAANMYLTETEAERFWPIYDRYTAELATINDTKYDLITEYAQNFTTMTSEQAESYIQGRAAVEESVMQLRLKYAPIFRTVLSGKATAQFFQLDWRLGLIRDLQLASQTPLIEP
jgi:hypothetical protein